MEEEKIYCAYCGEDCEFELGRRVWISDVDGSKGHQWCMRKYDEAIIEERDDNKN